MAEDLHIPHKADRRVSRGLIRRVIHRAAAEGKALDWNTLAEVMGDVEHQLGNHDQQNWLELERWAGRATAGGNGFDATIDGAAQSNNPQTHVYQNIAGLLAGEVWDSTRTFVVRVVGRPPGGTPSVDTGGVSFPGPVIFVGEGTQGQYNTAPNFGSAGQQNYPGMDIRGLLTGTKSITFIGIEVYNGGVGALANLVDSATTLHLQSAQINGMDSTDTAVAITALGAFSLFAEDSSFICTFPKTNGASFLKDCDYSPGMNGNSATLTSSTPIFWDGGVIVNQGSLTTLAITSGIHFFRWTDNKGGTYQAAGVSGTYPILAMTISGGSGTVIANGTIIQDLTITNAAGSWNVRADLRTLTHAGTTGVSRVYDVTLAGLGTGPPTTYGLDLTDQCDCRARWAGTVTSHYAARIQGAGVRLELHVDSETESPSIKYVSATNSLVIAEFANGSAHAPYNFDAGSSHNLLILGGSNPMSAGVNAGTANRIITENGSGGIDTSAIHSGDAAGGDLSGTLPNPTVDKIQGKDIFNSWAPTDGQLIYWDNANSRFDAKDLIAPGVQVMVTKSGIYNLLCSSSAAGGAHGFAVRAYPVYFPKACTVSELGIEMTTNGEANSYVILGIYDSLSNGYPGTKLGDTAHIATSAGAPVILTDTTPMTAISIPRAGLYWIVSGVGTTGAGVTSPTFRAVSNVGGSVIAHLSALGTDLTNTVVGAGDSLSGGNLKSTFTTTPTSIGAMPRIYVKIQ